MATTPRLALPFLVPGQAQKELFHNEALQILDMVVAAAAEEEPLDTPPSAPTVGACYIVGADPDGAWSEHPSCLACFTAGGWRFVPPREGMRIHISGSGKTAVYQLGAWDIGSLSGSRVMIAGQQVLGERAGAIENPSSGSIVDQQSREAIGQILAAMRQHGLIEI